MSGCVVGYIRQYQRWTGEPGMSVDDQRAWIREIARERGYGARVGRQFLFELRDGERCGWPVLQQAIERADSNADRDLMVVVPTLDGVQFKLSFLELLADCAAPVYVRSGWRRPRIVIGKGTNYQQRTTSPGWLLSIEEERVAFREMVDRVRERNDALSATILAGLARAEISGVPLGSHRLGSYEFNNLDRSRGGKMTGYRRERKSLDDCREWLDHIRDWSKRCSLGQIVDLLARKNARTRDGRRFGKMLVYRILKRLRAQDALKK